MERVTREGGAPFDLVAGIEARHKGLRHLELHQHRGRAGTTRTGLTYNVKLEDRYAEYDERPSDTAEEIAAAVFADATQHHEKHKGNTDFVLSILSMQKDGSLRKTDVRFSLSDGDGGDVVDLNARLEAQSRASFVEELKGYVAQLHKRDDQRSDAINGLFKAYAEGAKDLFSVIVQTVIPNVLDVRLDALEDRAEAYELGASLDPKRRRWTRRKEATAEGPSSSWKEAAEGLKAFLGGPMGQIGLAKALGVPQEQLAKYVEQTLGGAGGPEPSSTPQPVANSAPGVVDIRPTVKKLYFALSAEERNRIKAELGEAWVKAVGDAGLAADPNAATAAMKRALDGMSEAQLDTLQAILNPAQQAIIDELFTQLETIAKG